MEVAGYKKTFSIDQGDVLGQDQLFQALFNQPLTDGKRNGICTGLSMIWLARLMMFDKDSAEDRKRTLRSSSSYRWGGKTQDIHVARSAVGGTGSWVETFYADALKTYVLKIKNGSLVDKDGGDPAILAPPVAKSVTLKHAHSLYNVGLQTPTGSAGHMVASYASSGKLGFNRHLYFFDPNMGEYKIGIDETEAFLKAWLQAYKDGFSGLNYFSSFGVVRG